MNEIDKINDIDSWWLKRQIETLNIKELKKIEATLGNMLFDVKDEIESRVDGDDTKK